MVNVYKVVQIHIKFASGIYFCIQQSYINICTPIFDSVKRESCIRSCLNQIVEELTLVNLREQIPQLVKEDSKSFKCFGNQY